MGTDDDLLARERAVTPRQAAELLGMAQVTLEQWRRRGDGPRFWRVGRRVRYRLADVLAFREARTVGKQP
jgi:excisionase family DNA binding protein